MGCGLATGRDRDEENDVGEGFGRENGRRKEETKGRERHF